MIEIRPSVTEDFRLIALGYFDGMSAPNADMAAASRFWAGKAVSAVEDGCVLGIAGVIVCGDEGTVTMLLSDELRRRPSFLHRIARRHLVSLMNRHGLRRLHATVYRDFATARRWVERLGFVYDGAEGDWERYVYER